MAQPQHIPHFWMPGQASYSAIVGLKDAGTQECGAPYYWIRRDAYRGMLPDLLSSHKLDVVVVRLTTPQLGPDGLYREVKRDILWVECKAPCHDNPGTWKRVIEEATERLKSAHPDRNVWLIMAIGLKWMVFYWDPRHPRTTPFLMGVMMYDGSSGWTVDPDIRLPPQPPQPNNNQAPVINVQRYVNLTTGTIFADMACSLDLDN